MKPMQRRTLITATGAALALPAAALAQQARSKAPLPSVLAPNPQAFRRIVAEFTQGAVTQSHGLDLDVPVLADNPSGVPIKVKVTEPMTAQDWCEEIIVLADLNPEPLACRMHFTPAAGIAEASVRARLSQSQTIHALARMKSGRILAAKQSVTVAASGCGM